MTLRCLLLILLLFPFIAASEDSDVEMSAIGALIDGFHDAAAHGDKDRYLGYMTDDGVFLGTDEWERWPKHPEIRIADSGETAWFDEVVFSEQNGRFRGTGVVSKQDGEWKIAHYAMSFLILNENWPAVIELTKKTMASKAAGE
jgi:ketosteroid isomerase-like protein